jgi:ATP-binding cassette subfamily B protein
VQPQKGSIEVNGQNIESFSLYDWRDRMGYVNQDAALFFGTIRSNILLGKKELAEADLDEACRRAGCYDFIQSLPQGYDTMVGQRGHALSGGQRKRIAIARALVGHSQFLILDEATTSFQTSIETDIVDKLRAHCPDLTIILVSHRLSGFSDPDITINIEGGDALVTHHRAI